MMETRRPEDRPEVLETVYDDDHLRRVHDSEHPVVETPGNPGYSKAILKVVKKMRKGSIADNNNRSKRIAKALLKERRKKTAKVVKPPAKPVQRTIMDFGGN